MMALVLTPKAHAEDSAPACVPTSAWTETITDSPAYDETVFDHWQRYSWTGGPHAEDDPPAFPSSDWQPNVEGDPHGIGHAGAYYRSNGNSGNGDWFYLEAVTAVVHHDAVTHTVDHDAVTCPTEPTSEPTSPSTEPTTPTTEPTEPTTEPTSPTTEPTTPTTEPTTPTTEPTQPTTEPTLPTEPTETPTTPTTAPTTVPTSPSTSDIPTPTSSTTTTVVKTHTTPPTSPRVLPNTGGISMWWVFGGAWLIIIGLFCVLMAGRKKLA